MDGQIGGVTAVDAAGLPGLHRQGSRQRDEGQPESDEIRRSKWRHPAEKQKTGQVGYRLIHVAG